MFYKIIISTADLFVNKNIKSTIFILYDTKIIERTEINCRYYKYLKITKNNSIMIHTEK